VNRRRLAGFVVAGALGLAGASVHAQAGVEGVGSPANEGRDVREEGKATECPTAMTEAADDECREYWESHINWWSWDYKGGSEQSPEHRHMPPPFAFALINFAVFAAIMYKLAAKPLQDFVRTRHLTIRKNIDEAAVLHREAEAKLREYEGKIASLDREIETLLAQVRAEAEAEKARIVEGAARQAERLKAEAEAQIRNELERVRRELKVEAVNAAVAAAQAAIGEKAGAEDQARLVERFVAEMEGARPNKPVASPTAAGGAS
jgi:F-type H+-transporting ATPase subunit b